MRLSAKFVLLIAGTVLTPLLAILLVFQLTVGRRTPESPPRALETIHLVETLTRMARQGVDPAQIPEALRAVSPETAVIVFDEQSSVLYSSLAIDSLPEFLSMKATSRRYSFHRVVVPGPGGRSSTVVVGFPGMDLTPGPYRLVVLLIVVSSVIGFLGLMSLLIIRSINRSLAHLEEATRRIAEGDLDFTLEARGTDRIASLTRSFDSMRERVREEAATRSRFILAISHDLKTPLASICGHLDAIRDGLAPDPERLQSYLRIARSKAGLLESRISQLIDYVKLETSEWRSARERVPLATFLGEAVTAFSAEAEARGFRLAASVGVDPSLSLLMDGDLVYRALENLVDNAFRHADSGTEIEIRLERGEECLFLLVRNRGREIDPKDLPFLFEPFYRGNKARRETGFGLGLSVVKSVVASHGWDITVRSAEGLTEFRITIPLPRA